MPRTLVPQTHADRFGSCRHHVMLSMAVAALVVAGLVSLQPMTAKATVGPASRPRLLVIGDSIILGTAGKIAAALPEWDVTIDAVESRSTADGLEVLPRHGTDFSVVVIELGANDGETPSVFRPRVAALLDALRPAPHVVWLTIHEARPYYVGANAIIRDEAARYDNAVVADWNAKVEPADVAEDGLHLTPHGSTVMADWIADHVRRVVAPPPSTTSSTTSTTPPSTTPFTTSPTTIAATPMTIDNGVLIDRGTGYNPIEDSLEPRKPWPESVVIALSSIALAVALFVLARRV